MRFSVASVLLGTALAAPIQDTHVGDASKESQHDSVVVRGLIDLLPRAIAPIVHPEPVPVRPVEPPAHPLDPVGPEAPPLKPGTEPDTPGTTPEEPPRLGKPEEPAKPAPGRVGAGCLLKRCEALPGADTTLRLDERYTRKQTLDDFDDPWMINKEYLKDYKLDPDTLGKENPWHVTKIDNGADAKKVFEEKVIDQYAKEEDLIKAGWDKDWAKTFRENQLNQYGSKGEATFLNTFENPKKGAIFVESSHNAQHDLHRAYTGEYFEGKQYTRPANPGGEEPIWWSQMVMDNWRTAVHATPGADIKGLRTIVRNQIDNDVTEAVLKTAIGGETKKSIVPSDPNFAKIRDTTVHGRGVQRLLNENAAELGNLKVTSYDIIMVEGKPNMVINIAP